jgi:peptide deformylase
MEIVTSALKIVQYPHPALRHKARSLTGIDKKITTLAEAMLDLMYEHKGLGLAAPQVGVPFAMFVCNLAGDPAVKDAEYVFLNPVITERKGSMEGEEGCLSFPGMYRKVRRARSIVGQAYNLQGELVTMEASELVSRLWQHETDHLAGVLFIDKLGPVGQLASKGELAAFEHEYHKAQRKGEIPPDADIEKMLSELELQA